MSGGQGVMTLLKKVSELPFSPLIFFKIQIEEYSLKFRNMGQLNYYGNVTITSDELLDDNQVDCYCGQGRLVGFTYANGKYIYIFNYD